MDIIGFIARRFATPPWFGQTENDSCLCHECRSAISLGQDSVHEYNGSICISIDYNNIAFLNAWSSSIDHELNEYELDFQGDSKPLACDRYTLK